MHEDISRRTNTTITNVGDVRIIEKLDTTVDGLTANKRNKDSTDIFEGASKSIDVKKIKKFDSSGRVNFANSIPVEMDSKPAAASEPIKTAHLSNPFNKDFFLETLDLPVIAELNLTRDGTPGSSKVESVEMPP